MEVSAGPVAAYADRQRKSQLMRWRLIQRILVSRRPVKAEATLTGAVRASGRFVLAREPSLPVEGSRTGVARSGGVDGVGGDGERISPCRESADWGREGRGDGIASCSSCRAGEVWRQWRLHLGSSGVLSLA